MTADARRVLAAGAFKRSCATAGGIAPLACSARLSVHRSAKGFTDAGRPGKAERVNVRIEHRTAFSPHRAGRDRNQSGW